MEKNLHRDLGFEEFVFATLLWTGMGRFAPFLSPWVLEQMADVWKNLIIFKEFVWISPVFQVSPMI